MEVLAVTKGVRMSPLKVRAVARPALARVVPASVQEKLTAGCFAGLGAEASSGVPQPSPAMHASII